ncbi:cobyrinate a,c-diamide synthase [Bacillus sp. CGMCC 1.16607]|uniref:cobyrinate a,c-diamide synthase n=1 Tax=Bacillus sp. CGMCC 1.16607 TaxID=3351842 RepID=UPI0036375CC1
MTSNRLVVAGVSSGAGKTSITIGLMAAFKQKGITVQGFKCGPDYIDPTFHTAVTKRPSRNLDSWMLSEEVVKEVFHRGSQDADISIIEGVMGFYDGKSPLSNKGSTAEISILLDCPTILVVDCSKMARSAAAIVKGFQALEPRAKIAGVIANKVGSLGHYQIIKEAVEQECGIPVCGYLLKDSRIEMPERHLGLVPAIERGELDENLNQLGKLVSETFDLNQIFQLSKQTPLNINISNSLFKQRIPMDVKVAVAKDEAFHFYYQENLDLIESFGGEIVYFSPLKGEKLPEDADGLYIGGGFPELFADKLSVQVEAKRSIYSKIMDGLPTLAECGGFMFLTETIETIERDQYPMVGVIPGVTKMQDRLAAIGYREISELNGNYLFNENQSARGHEYHYSTYHPSNEHEKAYYVKGMFGEGEEGFLYKNVIAGYTHIHFASCPSVLENFLLKCKEWKHK